MTDVDMRLTADEATSREHPHIGVLFERARRLLNAAIVDRLQREGFGDVREGHGTLFVFLPPGGVRLTELARRARITKQSMGELVRDLEALGYVERVPDPEDGRAKTVMLTPRGKRANAIGLEAVAEMERQWAQQVGEEQVSTVRSVLEQITRPAH